MHVPVDSGIDDWTPVNESKESEMTKETESIKSISVIIITAINLQRTSPLDRYYNIYIIYQSINVELSRLNKTVLYK